MSPDDATLLNRWTAQGDAEAFNAIVDRFADQVYATCRRILRNDADAEDVAQECFLHLVRAGGDVRASLGGWLHRAATTKSLDRIRRDASRRAREQAYGETADVGETPSAEWDDIQRHIDEAIETLPEETRHAIVSHFLGRKTHAEVAEELHVSRRAVSYRIERGLEAIRRELNRRGVSVTGAALGSALAMEATAAPLSLKASLGKLAIAAGTGPGGGVAATTASVLGSLVLMKAKIGGVLAILCLIATGIVYLLPDNKEPAAPAVSEVSFGAPPAGVAPETMVRTVSTAEAFGKPAASITPENPASLEDLLALSRAIPEQSLKPYVSIEDPAQHASISGVVLDQDAYPVAGATVHVIRRYAGAFSIATGETFSATSGADGAYVVAGITTVGPFIVTATKRGYADVPRAGGRLASIDVEPGMSATGVDLVLHTGISLGGTVVAANGEPVSGAVVRCVGVTSPALLGSADSVTRADPAGRFTLGFEARHRGGTASLQVASDGRGAGKFPAVPIEDTEDLELRLAASAIVHGTVRQGDGSPVPNALVNFAGGKETVEDSYWGLSIPAPCDAEGRYAVELHSGLDYKALARETMRGPSRELEERVLDLQPGETREFNVTFAADEITVRGAIIGQRSGKPLKDSVMINVIVTRDSDGQEVAQEFSHTFRPYTVSFRGDAGIYTLQARYSPDDQVAGPVSRPLELAPGDEVELDLEIPDPQVLSVRAVDHQGAPLEGVAINLFGAMGSTNPVMQSKEDGRFPQAVSMAPGSSAYFELSKPGYATARGPVYEDPTPGVEYPEATITLWPGAGFEGDLLDIEGQPITNQALRVTVTNRDGQTWPLEISTDARGHFTVVDQAPADIVEIAIRAGEGALELGQVQLEAGAITNLGAISLE